MAMERVGRNRRITHLRVGLMATAGVPSAFYFDTPPIPPEGFYTHHPPLLSLLLTAMFAVFGEAEWVARLLPMTFSLIGAVLLWLLVKDCTNARTAAFAVIAFAAMPMELRYGRMVNFEPIDLVWMLGALLCLRYWETFRAAALVVAGRRGSRPFVVDRMAGVSICPRPLCCILRFLGAPSPAFGGAPARGDGRFAVALPAPGSRSATGCVARHAEGAELSDGARRAFGIVA